MCDNCHYHRPGDGCEEELQFSYTNGEEPPSLPPWLDLPVDDYDMGVVTAQWWAEKEYGEGIASR